jgi:5-dehydro-2-deoxygluconokinase
VLDLIAIGRAGVDLYSLDYGAPLEEARKFAKYVGGTAANTVVGGSRLGLRCALVSRVSADELGSFVLGFLKKEGVDVSHVVTDPVRKTGVVFAEVSPGRDGRFLFYRENVADLWVAKADVGEEFLAGTKALLVTGTGLSREPSLGANLHAGRAAERLGKTVVFNLDWRPALWDSPEEERLERYAKMMEHAGVLIGNEKEYMAAAGGETLDEALAALPGAAEKTVVVTSGERGSEVRVGGKRWKAPGFRVPLLKGLGGGDGFIAGFLYGHLQGWGPREAAVFGNAVGAIVVTGHACSESMPRLPKVTGFLKESGYSFDPATGPFKR